MRLASPFIGILTIILLVAIPVGGSPALQVGSHATYNLKATLSFPPPICETDPSSGMSSIVSCPMSSMIAIIPPSINATGTFGWSATGLNSSSVALNVTHDITISSDGLMIPSIHRTGSFNESVNLATRIISIFPFLKSEMDSALQMDQSIVSASSSAGIDPSMAMSQIESTMFQPHPIHTMWWINNASSVRPGQTVPVLFFPTNVTGSTSIDLGSLGTRQAWTLTFSPGPFAMSNISTNSSATGSTFGITFTFNYDQKSGVLLSASVNIHFNEEIVQSTGCSTSSNPPIAWCNNGSVVSSSCGFNLSATLTLATTSLNLDQSMSSGGSTEGGTPASSGGSTGTGSSGSGSGIGSGSGTGEGSGSGSGTGSGSNSGSGSSAGNSPSPASAQPSMAIAPWIYLLLGLVIVAIVSAGLWIARRRSKKSATSTPQ